LSRYGTGAFDQTTASAYTKLIDKLTELGEDLVKIDLVGKRNDDKGYEQFKRLLN
jgi:hypothetical protein